MKIIENDLDLFIKKISLLTFLIFLFLSNINFASDLITQKINIPSSTILKNQPFKPTFVICNINIFDALSNEWHVRVKIFDQNENEVFNEKVSGVFLAKGSSGNPTCVTLKTNSSFTPSTTGNYTVSVDVNYDHDINTSNDKITKQFSVTNPPTYNISGKILEDKNYGGNVGSFTGTPRPGVTIELYNSSGTYLAGTITSGDGSYLFSDVVNGNYIVRVVNNTITSSRPRNAGTEGEPICVQTFRTNASSGSPVDVINKVGGEVPSKIDAVKNTGGQNLSNLTTTSTIPQSITSVKVANHNVNGVNFAYNFSTIVNTNSESQGSLKQFIINSNILSNNGLAQIGQTGGVESSIFMIPSSSDPLSRPADPNFNGTTFIISPISEYPPITDKVKLDGFIQTNLSGNTNPNRPEIVLDGTSAGETATCVSFLITDCRLTGLTIQKFGGNGIFCNSKIFLGTENQADKSVECLNNGFHGIQSKSADYVGNDVLVLEKNGQDGIRIENELDVDGIRCMENSGWGVRFGDVFQIRKTIGQRSYFWENGLGGINGSNGLLSGSYIDCSKNGDKASNGSLTEGQGINVKTAVLRGVSTTENKNDGIIAETIQHKEVDGMEKLISFDNGGFGIKLKGTMTADGINIQRNGKWGILCESGNVYVLKDSKNARNVIWNNAKGGISVKAGIFKGKFLDFNNNGQGATSSDEGFGLVAKIVIVNGIEVSNSKNDGIKAESISHTRILGQEDLLSIYNGGHGINVKGNIEADGIRANNNRGWGAISENGSINIKLDKSRNFASYNNLGGLSAVNGSINSKWLFTSGNGELAQNSSEGHGIIAGRVTVQELSNGGNKGDGIRAQFVNVSNGFSITDNEGFGIFGAKVRVSGIKIQRNKKGGIKLLRNVKRSNILAKSIFSNESDLIYSINIENSTISDNNGNGIDVEYFTNSLIQNNNILRNSGFDLFSSEKEIQANNNWWGDNSLPNSNINELVTVDNWLADSLSLFIFSENNSYILPAGKNDSILFSIVNISNPEDSLNINITDSLGWIDEMNYDIGINDSTGGKGVISISIPNSTVEQNIITIDVSSNISGLKESLNLFITSYSPIYSELKILEDSLTIGFGDTINFKAVRIDQNGKESFFLPSWSSLNNSINNSGTFINDSTIGIVEVTVEDSESALSNSTHVYSTDEQIVLTEIQLKPKNIKISSGDIFEFVANGKNQFGFPMNFNPVWVATGGTIDINGLFIAGENSGNYQVTVSDSSGVILSTAQINILVGLETDYVNLPENFRLFQNYPNPFNPTTTIEYSIPVVGTQHAVFIQLTIYDLLGRKISTLVNKKQNLGYYKIEFDGKNLTSGVYFYRIQAGDFIETKKMIIMK